MVVQTIVIVMIHTFALSRCLEVGNALGTGGKCSDNDRRLIVLRTLPTRSRLLGSEDRIGNMPVLSIMFYSSNILRHDTSDGGCAGNNLRLAEPQVRLV